MTTTGDRPSRRRTAKVETALYVNSHLREPRGRGGWLFENIETDEVINLNGTYTDAKKRLPPGTWLVLP